MIAAAGAQEGLSRRLAAALAAIRPEDLPPALIERVKLFVLDTLGVLGGAAAAPGVPNLTKLLGGWSGGGGATSLLGGWRGAPDAAAMANATAAHALDFDDQHDDARIHAYCVNLPAALAAAEARGGIDGRRFIAALAVGVELDCRLGLAAASSIGNGWHPTTAHGHLAAAVTAGHVLGLDGEGMLAALGIAYAQLAGSAQGLFEQAMTKRFGPGFAARSGVLAAFLAEAGVTGPRQLLEGRAGFIPLYERGAVDADRLMDGLGRDWEALRVSMKPFPCCRCNHSTIQLALDLRAAGVRPEQVACGTIRLGRINWSVVGGRYDPATAANPVVHAQFSAAYAFAQALVHGHADLEAFRPPAITDPAVIALTRRLEVLEDATVAPTALAPAAVELGLADGTSLVRAKRTVLGSPEEPMSEAEVVAKFRKCLAEGLDVPAAAADGFAAQVMALDRAPDAAALARGFVALQERT